MRIGLVAASIAFLTVNGAAHAASLRACEQVSALVEEALRSRPAKPDNPATEVATQFRACLPDHYICSIVSNASGDQAMVIADLTSELPAQINGPGSRSSPALMVRSIPRVRNDTNQYCLVLEKVVRPNDGKQWDIYGWVIAPTARHAVPLKKQPVDNKLTADSESLRALAAELWLFAERMSGAPTQLDR
jgi:hypothetical protein